MSANHGTSFGARLQRERQSRGISLAAVVEYTKISPKNLRALEANRLHELPGGFYNRSFVRAYAESIGVNPDFTVRAYEEEVRSRAPARIEARTAAPRRSLPPPRVPRMRWLHWPLVVALATCAAAGLTFGRWLRAYAGSISDLAGDPPAEARFVALLDLSGPDPLCREAAPAGVTGAEARLTSGPADGASISSGRGSVPPAPVPETRVRGSAQAGPSGSGGSGPERQAEGPGTSRGPSPPRPAAPDPEPAPPATPGHSLRT